MQVQHRLLGLAPDREMGLVCRASGEDLVKPQLIRWRQGTTSAATSRQRGRDNPLHSAAAAAAATHQSGI